MTARGSGAEEAGSGPSAAFGNVVVTGAGGGIGAAYARMFAEAGARVVVNDLDAERAHALAREIDGIALPGDASTAAERSLALLDGRVDVYCANAGVATEGGPEASDSQWQASWDLNVMAHVRAARALLPGWSERGEGRFVATVSAAGVLTMVGSAPYSVSKHAALAFAEWLSVTHRHRGLRVHAVCPQGVRTDMLAATGRTGELVLAPSAIEAVEVAQALREAIAEGRFLVLPHPEVAGYAAARAADPDAWLSGMNRLQQKLEAPPHDAS
ncbi:SDR family oxidoreductase [Streptomyces sp. XM4193]|uniref:SDR family oxidoreductase n=1 Tax=Streptomyces sp. XM4193 TaxID=2929782 RepID=UPI0024A666FC|nr:SDR family NAD(P)-dependent oxidoreductase [Streptomyces sp. XM4193]